MKTIHSMVCGCFMSLFCLQSHAEIRILPDGTLVNPRTHCGTNDMVKMIDQDVEFQKMGGPIGRYESSSGYCTGTLISKDLFLTARHCMASCSVVKVKFGYLTRAPELYPCKEIVEYGDSSTAHDYLILRLDGSPGDKWGWYGLSDEPLTADGQLLMIHHPAGSPMKVSLKDCLFKRESSGMVHHRCDTEGGSSGTGILKPDFDKPQNSKIIAVHTLGGCGSSPTSTNSGPSIRHIATISPLVKEMVEMGR